VAGVLGLNATQRKLALTSVLLPVLAGCSAVARSPSISIFGSFFPVWILCAVAGVILTAIARVILIRTGIDEYLPVPALVYLCLAIGSSIGFWLLWSGGFA
jgi:hypothetical protein